MERSNLLVKITLQHSEKWSKNYKQNHENRKYRSMDSMKMGTKKDIS